MILVTGMLAIPGCSETGPAKHADLDREAALPADMAKRGPDTDHTPPILHAGEFAKPAALPYPVNTAGAEDSPFILPDGKTLYLWFTPDVRVPPEKQLLDGVTGVYVSRMTGGAWSKAERVWLQDPGKLALDGCVAVREDEMWFCSAREGYTGINMFTAQRVAGNWANWRYAGDRLMKEVLVGEVHPHGDELYFHSDRPGGKGGYDIWVTARKDGAWSDPVNIAAVNSDALDGYPFVSADGKELWFTRTHLGTPAIFRSLRTNGVWGKPELVVSQFAGEPTLDAAGNLYFTHHYYETGTMIEADIYVAYRK